MPFEQLDKEEHIKKLKKKYYNIKGKDYYEIDEDAWEMSIFPKIFNNLECFFTEIHHWYINMKDGMPKISDFNGIIRDEDLNVIIRDSQGIFLFTYDYESFFKKYITEKEEKRNFIRPQPVAGVYKPVFFEDYGWFLEKVNVGNVEEPILNNNLHKKMKEEIELFQNQKHVYDEIGVDYKRGILLHGSPGNGKTSFIKSFCAKGDFMTILADTSGSCLQFLEDFLGDEDNDNMLKIVVFEDIDGINPMIRSRFLNFLDGMTRIHNTIFIATTNLPDNLDVGIRDRPNRFDLILKVDNPDENTRKKLLLKYFPNISKAELKNCVKKTEGFSGAYFKEIYITSRLRKLSPFGAICEIIDRVSKNVVSGEEGDEL